MTDRILSHSSFIHIVDVPIERIDIADWLFNLPEAEYQRCCPPDHIAAGVFHTLAQQLKGISLRWQPAGQKKAMENFPPTIVPTANSFARATLVLVSSYVRDRREACCRSDSLVQVAAKSRVEQFVGELPSIEMLNRAAGGFVLKSSHRKSPSDWNAWPS